MTTPRTPEQWVRLATYIGCALVGLGGLAYLTLIAPPERVNEALILALVALTGAPLGVGIRGLSQSESTPTRSPSDSADSSEQQSSSPTRQLGPAGGDAK